MNAIRMTAIVSGLMLSVPDLAIAQERKEPRLGSEAEQRASPSTQAPSVDVVAAFFEVSLRGAEEIEAVWSDFDEEQRQTLRVDCSAALEVGTQVPSPGSATGAVAQLPEVEKVDEDIRNQLEAERAAPEGAAETSGPLEMPGAQRRALMADTVPAEVWTELCQMLAGLDETQNEGTR